MKQEIQLFIEGERVEFFNDETVSITQTIQNVKDISKVFTDFSKSFTVPASKTNNKIFKHYYNFDIENGFDARKKKNAKLEINNIPFRDGKIKLEGVQLKNNKPYSYRITFFGNTVDLKDLLGEDNLASLDWLNNFNKQYSASLVRTGLTTGYGFFVDDTGYADGLITPLITHTTRLYYNSDNSDHAEYPDANGGNLYPHGSHHHGVYYEELKYAIRIHIIIRAISKAYGIVFSNDFFNITNAPYHNLYMWLHRKKGRVFDSTTVTYQIRNFPIDDGISMTKISSFQDRLTVFGVIGNTMQYTLRVNTTTTNPYSIIIKKEGEVFAQVYNSVGGTGTISGFLSDSLAGYTVFIETNNTLSITSVQWELTDLELTESHTYTSGSNSIPLTQEFIITEQIPEMKVIDFLTGIFKMFNLTAFERDGTIIVQTLDSFYADSTTAWDISQYMDVNESSSDVELPYKRIDFKYEGLGTKLAKQHEQANISGWGTTKYDDGDNLDAGNGIYSVSAPFEHMKYERLIDSFTDVIKTPQVGWFVDDNNDPYYGKPLLTYAVKVTGDTIRFLNEETGAGGTFTDITSYYVPSNSLALSSGTSTVNINYNLEVNEYTFGSDFTGTLFQTYYSDYISDVFNLKRRIVKVKAYLPIKFLVNYTLADTIIIGTNSYIINSITTDLTTGESSLELLNKL